MKEQLDIFGTAPTPSSKRRSAKQKSAGRKQASSTRTREVKKAPMLVDAYQPDADARPAGKRAADANESVTSSPPQQITSTQDVVDATENARHEEPMDAPRPKVFSISEITECIKEHLEGAFIDVWVSGEVTDFRNRTGRHYYFALKDERAKIRAIIWNAESRKLPFELADGMKLICRGQLNVYGPSGSYSLVIDPRYCEPEGIGALQLAFEQLKKRLEAEGLFSPERKRPIPMLPKRIGIITAATGAAIRDLIHVLTRRYPNIEVLLHPVRVQGEAAGREIAEAIATMNEQPDLDLLIVGRGGGSIEDLWAFNEEVTARAIAASKLPVISAVGHEIDFTIADFVADLRAATPSAAAELAVPIRDDLLREIAEQRSRLALALRGGLERRRLELRELAGRLGDPRRRLPDLHQRLDAARERLIHACQTELRHREQHLAKLSSNLDHLSPLGVLAKGYAVVEGPSGKAVIDATSLKVGDEVKIRFRKGAARAKVTERDD